MVAAEKTLTYKRLTHHEHVLLRPDMYIGSVHAAETTTYLAEAPSLVNGKTVELVEGLVRIFIEPLSNAVDNVSRSRELGIVPKFIHVTVSSDTGAVTIENDGYSIPLGRKHDDDAADAVFLPEMLFGQLLTSSNYDDTEERFTSGKNGCGVAITNIFSRQFDVECADPLSELQYVQQWCDNMTRVSAPKITKFRRKFGFTRVTYVADFERFGVGGYSPDTVALFRRLVVDCAMLTRLPSVTFNGEAIPVRSLLDYARLYEGVVNTADLLYIGDGSRAEAGIEYVVGPSIGTENISFVNGIHTVHGGLHVDTVIAAVCKPLAEKLSKQRAKSMTVKDVKPMFTFWVNARVPNPEFASQNKTRLTAPPVSRLVAPLTPSHVSKITKWPEFQAQVNDWVRLNELGVFRKAEKKSRGFTPIKGYDPANLCRKRPLDCILILCEGLSAKTFAVTGITVGIGAKKGRDFWGIYALRGKMLNTRNASSDQVTKNREILDLIQILNLKFGVDYMDDAHFRTLNYGQVMLVTDQDTDGFHIAGLFMNFMHSMFPTLFYRPGFIASMFTPIVNLYPSSGSAPRRFYNLVEAQAAIAALPPGATVKYLKGLGSSNDSDIRQTFGQRVCTYTVTSRDTVTREMEKVFSDKQAAQRKVWLQTYDPLRSLTASSAPYEEFLNTELIKFSTDDCIRNLPNLYDGLKQSQRKILFTFIQKGSEMKKVSQWAGAVSERTAYHHGEQCLFDTIIKMAQDFVGSNNIALLAKDGQFGSRLAGGKDAASARYVFAKLAPIARYIYRPEDAGILTYVTDDGVAVEPVNYAPIIPMLLVNGSTAIATGWSTSIPCFNPLELIAVVRATLDGSVPLHDMVPWYRGFGGTVHRESASKYVTRGKVTATGPGKWRITELPIGTWVDTQKALLEKMCQDKAVRTLVNHCTADTIRFDVDMAPDAEPVSDPYATFRLESALGMTNMVVLKGEHGTHIEKMPDVNAILADFVAYRLGMYGKRKAHILQNLADTLAELDNRIRFVRAVVARDITVGDLTRSELVAALDARGFSDSAELIRIPIHELTLDHIQSLVDRRVGVAARKAALEGTEARQLWLDELAELENQLK